MFSGGNLFVCFAAPVLQSTKALRLGGFPSGLPTLSKCAHLHSDCIAHVLVERQNGARYLRAALECLAAGKAKGIQLHAEDAQADVALRKRRAKRENDKNKSAIYKAKTKPK